MNYFKVPPSSLSFLRGLVMTNKANQSVTSMAAAYVLAQCSPFPPQSVGSPQGFFLSTQGEQMASFLDSILDIIPIDYKQIQEYAKKFFAVRHDHAFGCPAAPVTGPNTIYNLFHVGVYFSPEELEMLEDAKDFMGLVSGFESIHEALVACVQS